MIGWVKIHRSIVGHWVFEDAELFRCWILMITEANHESKKKLFNGAMMTIDRGQFIFGLEAFSRKTGVSISRLRRLLLMLEKDGMISRQKTNKFSLISITNYDEHQGDDRQKAGRRQADGRQTATPKECKEFKECEEEDKPPAKANRQPVIVDTYLKQCKESETLPMPPEDAIFKYADEAGIPNDFLRLCWLEFIERNRESKKRYKDWRKAFGNCARANWYKLWWIDNGMYMLTTNGKQAELKHKARGRAN